MKRTSLAFLLALLAAPVTAQDAPRSHEEGVFLPYKQLLELLKHTRRPTPPKVDDINPVQYVLHGAKLSGVAGEGVVAFEATFDIELSDPGWVVVPVGLEGASLEHIHAAKGGRPVIAPMRTLLPGLDATLRAKLPHTGFGLLLRGGGRQRPTIRFAVPVTARPGESTFTVDLPGAAISELTVALPEAHLRVTPSGALASELLPAQGDVTRVRSYYGAGATAKITWNPRPKQVEGSAPRDSLLFADASTTLRLEEGVLESRTRIVYRIHQAPCDTFKIRYPKGYTLLAVDAPGLSTYPKPVTKAGVQELTIVLHDKVMGEFSLDIRLEKILDEGIHEVEFPRIVTIGTERETGLLIAGTSEFLSLEPTRQTGLTQVNADDLEQVLLARLKDFQSARGRRPGRRTSGFLAFRYLRQPFSLRLKSSPIEPEVDGRLYSLVMIKDDEIALATTVRYTIAKRGIFGARLRLPKGFQLLECGPKSLVKDRRIEDGVLSVDFVREQGPGKLDLMIYGLLRRAPQPETLAVSVPLPRIGLLDVAKESAVIVVGAQSQLKLNLEAKSGLLPLDLSELSQVGFPYGANRGEDLIFGYRYARPSGVSASFKAQKREPKVIARVETLVDAQEDRVRVSTTIHYAVQYARIDRVRLQVPADLGIPGALTFDSAGIKDEKVELEGEKAIWTLHLQGTRIGTFQIHFTYDLKHSNFSAGQQRKVDLRPIQVLDCFSEIGDIALKMHENVVVDEWERIGIEKRDVRELPASLGSADAVQAYRYVGHPYKLTLRITKYDFKTPMGIEVQHLHQDELVAEDGSIKAEATFAVKNSREQSLTVLLPPGAKLQRIKLDGRNVNPTEGKPIDGLPSLQIHLGEVKKQRRDEPFQIRIRYDLPAQDGVSGLVLRPLRFPLAPKSAAKDDAAPKTVDVPIARFTRAAYLPVGETYLELETTAAKHWRQTGFWRGLTRKLDIPDDEEGTNLHLGIESVTLAIRRVKGMTQETGLYPKLVLPGRPPYLFESLDGGSKVVVHSIGPWAFYFLAALVVAGVVGLGVFLDVRKLAPTFVYPLLATGAATLLAIFAGETLRPFFGSALLGAVGLGGAWIVRGVWRETTVAGQERSKQRQDEQARVAKARAHAAEAEASLQGGEARS